MESHRRDHQREQLQDELRWLLGSSGPRYAGNRQWRPYYSGEQSALCFMGNYEIAFDYWDCGLSTSFPDIETRLKLTFRSSTASVLQTKPF